MIYSNTYDWPLISKLSAAITGLVWNTVTAVIIADNRGTRSFLNLLCPIFVSSELLVVNDEHQESMSRNTTEQ